MRSYLKCLPLMECNIIAKVNNSCRTFHGCLIRLFHMHAHDGAMMRRRMTLRSAVKPKKHTHTNTQFNFHIYIQGGNWKLK